MSASISAPTGHRTRTVKLSVTGFYEFFRNEQVTQSPGAGLQNFTFNVPHSVHRGVEVAADWRPLPGWRLLAAYTYLDQFYVDYTEQLSAGALTRRFDRARQQDPGHFSQRAVRPAGI